MIVGIGDHNPGMRDQDPGIGDQLESESVITIDRNTHLVYLAAVDVILSTKRCILK